MVPNGNGTVHLRTLDGSQVTLGAGAVGALQKQLKGTLRRPGEPRYDESISIWNGAIRKRPALVVQPESAQDVVAAVNFARKHGLLMSVKGGGHNIAGTALADGGLTLDMSRMNAVLVDPRERTAAVGPGCLLHDVDRETQKFGLATVLGFVSETGVAGLTLGGGLGYLARRFGWTVDNLLEVEIVTSDGEVLRANRRDHADLFWALRGGGGNFGVVTQFVYQLHPVGPEITGGIAVWPAETPEQAGAVLAAYRDLTEHAPRELAVFFMLQRCPPAPFLPKAWHGRRVAMLPVCHSGPVTPALEPLAPMVAALGDPIVNLVKPRPYAEQQSLLDATEPKGLHYYWKSELASALSEPLLGVIRDLSLENPVPTAALGFLHIGGALNDRASDDGAVGNRDARYAIGVLGSWDVQDPAGEHHRAWVRKAWNAFRPHATGGVYVNFLGEDEGEDRVRDAYRANLVRLAEVKRRHDPSNLFQVNKNIAPASAGRALSK